MAKKISEKEKKFAEALAKCGIETQAFVAAGYSTKGKDWKNNAHKIRKRTHVQKYLDQLLEEACPHREKIASIAEAQETLTSIMRQEATEEVVLPTGDRVEKKPTLREVTKAAETLLRTHGAFIDRSQVELSGAIPVVIKDDL